MKKQILFIQGAGKGAYKADEKLVASLRASLGTSYEIDYPVMQNEEEADYETWSHQITKKINDVKDNVILVGHSVGASVLVKFITEQQKSKAIAGVFLMAAPYWGGDGGWTYDGYEKLMLSDRINSIDLPLFLYHSDDDEVVPFAHLFLYAKKFPAATLRKLKGRGHQLSNNLSEVANDIKNINLISHSRSTL